MTEVPCQRVNAGGLDSDETDLVWSFVTHWNATCCQAQPNASPTLFSAFLSLTPTQLMIAIIKKKEQLLTNVNKHQQMFTHVN